MCGLVAIISKNNSGFFQTQKTMFFQMLVADMFRGLDSTGVYSVNNYGNLKWIKDASSAPFFLQKKDATEFFSDFLTSARIVVGHNRKATMGKVVVENAHPFVEGNICLVHNGTLHSHKQLADTVVDSHAVCHHINKHGYKSMFQKIDGAYALMWYNAAEKCFYFVRNDERPLHFIETDSMIYLASEGKMLDWIADRNNIGKYKVESVPVDKLYKFDLNTNKLTCENVPKKAKSSYSGYQMTQYYSRSHLDTKSSSKTSSTSGASKASINSYYSGEKLLLTPIDWHDNGNTTKIVFETTDGFETNAIRYFPHAQFSQDDIDNIIAANKVRAEVSQVVSKKGVVTLFVKDVVIVTDEEKWVTRTGRRFTNTQIAEAGGCCHMCGTKFEKKEDVEFAEMRTDSSGEITYMTCESCSDQVAHLWGNTYHGYC
jgi:hypothetical protein